MPTILAIESSCDETSASVCSDGIIRSNIIATQKVHEQYGGVVPELASRAHMQNIVPVVDAALKNANCTLNDIDAFAFTQSPGLIGALLVGGQFAKSLALACNKPLIGVHHMQAHVVANLIENPKPSFPFLCLTVSGGHTQIVLCESPLQMKVVGQTIDDAAGEAFDKIARIMGLGFPGGPVIDKAASDGNKDAILFPRGLTQSADLEAHRYDFSFSGLKTAVSRYLKQTPNHLKADVAASFQEAVVDVLISKSIAACKDSGIDNLVIAGGVAANSRLRELAKQRCEVAKIALRIPPAGLCTDNGAMVAALGSLAINEGVKPSQTGIPADSAASIAQVIW